MTVRIKICGITRLDDAASAVDQGADFLGFVFHQPSPRYISPSQCRRIIEALEDVRSVVKIVGVFVDQSYDVMCEVIRGCGIDYAQLSGDEAPQILTMMRERAFKAVRPKSPQHGRRMAAAYANPGLRPSLLLDAHSPGLYGGTGTTTDLQLAAELSESWDLMLAGGLTESNVGNIVRRVRPWGVDVSSGIETSPGVKDHDKIGAFIEQVRSAA